MSARLRPEIAAAVRTLFCRDDGSHVELSSGALCSCGQPFPAEDGGRYDGTHTYVSGEPMAFYTCRHCSSTRSLGLRVADLCVECGEWTAECRCPACRCGAASNDCEHGDDLAAERPAEAAGF